MGSEAVTPSKPIDFYCPALAVSYEDFSDLYWSFDKEDRYFHAGLMVHHGMVAIWNWNSGSWWYSEEVSTLVQAVRAGLLELEGSREYPR